MYIAAFFANLYNFIRSSSLDPSSARQFLATSTQRSSQRLSQKFRQELRKKPSPASFYSTSRTALLLILVCSACKPLLTTDSSPANPEPNLEKMALSPVYRQAKIAIATPIGWKPVKVAGIKYAVFSLDSSTSISILEQNFAGNLPAFVQTNLQAMAIAFSAWRQVSEAEFQTNKGMVGKIVVTQSLQLNLPLSQRFYFFTPEPRSDRQLIVICSAKPEVATALAATCDASLKTLIVSP
jgi:hypothetical protein